MARSAACAGAKHLMAWNGNDSEPQPSEQNAAVTRLLQLMNRPPDPWLCRNGRVTVKAQGETPHGSPEAALNMAATTGVINSIPAICGEDTLEIGQRVWVNGMAPMEGINGQILDSMPGVITRFHKEPAGWLVEVEQLSSVALPIVGDPFRCFFKLSQISA